MYSNFFNIKVNENKEFKAGLSNIYGLIIKN